MSQSLITGRKRRLRLRRDKYKGLVVSLDGCDHPIQRSRRMYAFHRAKGATRRECLAIAAWTVAGSDRARHYLVRVGWEPGR